MSQCDLHRCCEPSACVGCSLQLSELCSGRLKQSNMVRWDKIMNILRLQQSKSLKWVESTEEGQQNLLYLSYAAHASSLFFFCIHYSCTVPTYYLTILYIYCTVWQSCSNCTLTTILHYCLDLPIPLSLYLYCSDNKVVSESKRLRM